MAVASFTFHANRRGGGRRWPPMISGRVAKHVSGFAESIRLLHQINPATQGMNADGFSSHYSYMKTQGRSVCHVDFPVKVGFKSFEFWEHGSWGWPEEYSHHVYRERKVFCFCFCFNFFERDRGRLQSVMVPMVAAPLHGNVHLYLTLDMTEKIT